VALSVLLWLLTAVAWCRKGVEVDPGTIDRRGKTVAFVRAADTVVNKELSRHGLARVFTRYCDRAICWEWRVLEADAREKKRGSWSMPNAIPPWEFRRGRR
jgi:endonuclease YncB( thermonuclease family)